MFWVTIARSRPARSRSTRARCPAFGSAVHAGCVAPVPPGLPADVGVGDVVLQRETSPAARVPGPNALRAAEVGDAGVGGDPRAGENRDPLGVWIQLRTVSASTPSRRIGGRAPLRPHRTLGHGVSLGWSFRFRVRRRTQGGVPASSILDRPNWEVL